MACLAAHSSIPETSKPDIMKAYQPGLIMAKLSDLHEDFYPKPRTVIQVPGGWQLDDDPEALASFLSRESLVTLWNSLGDLLHKGRLKNIVAGRKTHVTTYEHLHAELKSLELLLNWHSTHTLDGKHVFICEGLLDNPSVGVRCVLAVAIDV